MHSFTVQNAKVYQLQMACYETFYRLVYSHELVANIIVATIFIEAPVVISGCNTRRIILATLRYNYVKSSVLELTARYAGISCSKQTQMLQLILTWAARLTIFRDTIV